MRFLAVVWLTLASAFALPSTAFAGQVPELPDFMTDWESSNHVFVPAGANVLMMPSYDSITYVQADAEFSVHRFFGKRSASAPTFGIGGLLQIGPAFGPGGVVGASPHLHLALGAQATCSVFGLQAGFGAHQLVDGYADAVNAFSGIFMSLGVASFVVQADFPIAETAHGERSFPILLTLGLTAKFPIRIELPPAQEGPFANRPAS